MKTLNLRREGKSLKLRMRTPGEQPAETNLTFEQEVVGDFSGLDSLPGFVLVIFERRDLGGAVFSRLVNSGERFRSRFSLSRRDLWKKYFAIAVNDSVLSYAFTRSITLDDGSAEFTLTFQLTFRVADPRKLAETREYDPLRKLCAEIGRVIARNCARRKAEMFRERFRELERIVIDGESARVRDYASALGFKIISIDLDKPLPKPVVIRAGQLPEADSAGYENQPPLGRTKERNSRAWQQEQSEGEIEFEYDQRSRRLDRQTELPERKTPVRRAERDCRLMEDQTEAIGQAMKHHSDEIMTPAEFREGYEVARQVTMGIQADKEGSELPLVENSSNKDVEPPTQPKSWTDETAVLINLLKQAGADADTTAWLRMSLDEIGARVFSADSTSDPEPLNAVQKQIHD